MRLDLADALGLLGLLLLGCAVGVTWGWPGVVGLVGGLLVTVSVVLAWRRSRENQ